MQALARVEGIFCGVSSGGAVSAALRLADQVQNATIVCIVCDRGDRYLSTGVFVADPFKPTPTNVEYLKTSLRCLTGLPTLVCFMADDDEETGLPWCGDCRRAWPLLQAAVEKRGAIALLRCNVGPRPVWKDPEHPLRHDPDFKVGGVPTVVWWDQATGTAGARLGNELEEAETDEEASRLIEELLDATAVC